jgi:YMGG-like Gly-zipper
MKLGIAGLLICTLLTLGWVTTGPASADERPAHPSNVKEWLGQQSRSKKKAIGGALVGALLGAAAARVRGEDPWKGAAAGAVAGAVVGFLVGKNQDRIYASRDQAILAAQYDPSQGYVARVEEVKFDPPQPKAGETANLYVRYLVVGPDPSEDIKVQMFRGLKYGDEYVMGAGPNEFVVPRGGGIVESTMTVTLPAKAPQGSYNVEALLEDTLGRFPQAMGINSLYIVA